MDDALRAERRRRNRLYVIGTAIAVAGVVMGTPLFAERTPLIVAKACAALGAVVLAFGRFAPDHVLRRFFS